jgi:hypothetical protein
MNNKKDVKEAVKEINSDSLKFSFRFGGSSSSITLSKKICALYLMLMNTPVENANQGYSCIVSFVNDCLGKWTKDDCRGFSEYVTTQMIQDMLESDDFDHYMLIYSSLSKS